MSLAHKAHASMEHVSPEKTLRVLEFYSGIGGMRYALEHIGISASVIEAFDINDMANDVYEHNFGHRPSQGNIQHLTAQDLNKYMADVWLLSPPCQPYTRQGLQKDVEDSRALSFLKLLEMLPLLTRPPTHLFLENVVGFECSVSHNRLVKALEAAGFIRQEFILTPLQFGIPYSRPRYFCLAKRLPYGFSYPQLNNTLHREPGPVAPRHLQVMVDMLDNTAEEQLEVARLSEPEVDLHACCRAIIDFLEPEMQSPKLTQYMVPDSLIDRWGDALDIVMPGSKRCCCFTKSYGRFVKGTGSFLTTESLAENSSKVHIETCGEPVISKQTSTLKQLKLRYFTPREIANLHSFPPEFEFPEHVSLKQRYALLGNSLSVAVVASLLQYLFCEKVVDASNTKFESIGASGP